MEDAERVMTFESAVHTALWGEERWLVSAHGAGPSIIVGGAAKGRTLAEAMPGFPLLVKEIDARDRLSVQVHPNGQTRLVTGGDAKTEMWCALDAGRVYAGLKEGVGAADVEAAVRDGRFEELMVAHDLKAGDVLFIPGGLVHAICEGTRVYEVQQSSDTTFRLYDWGRKGADGRPRQLHVEQALKAIDYSLPPPETAVAASCEFFDFSRRRVCGRTTVGGRGWTVLYAFRGAFSLFGVRHEQGASLLVSEGDDFTLDGDDAEVFITKGDKR